MPLTESRPALHYEIEGEGPPLVLAHALGCDSGMWDAAAGPLSARHTVVRYDVRCHGRSASVTGPFAMADLVADLERLLDELRMPAVSIVGLSMGGMIAMGFAIARPDRVQKLVLANTTSRYPEPARALWAERIKLARERGMRAVAGVAVDRLFAPAFAAAAPHVVERYRNRLLLMDPLCYAECCDAVAQVDFEARLGDIAAPTLVIAGGSDAGAPVPMSRAIASRIPAARLAILDEIGHLSCVESPVRFGALLMSFLDEPAAGAPSRVR